MKILSNQATARPALAALISAVALAAGGGGDDPQLSGTRRPKK